MFRISTAMGAVLIALVAGSPRPVGAHAQLERTVPAANERVIGAVDRVVFRFSEPVTAVPGSVRLTGPGGIMRQLTPNGSGALPTVEAAPGPLAPGAYVVQSEVISEDGHPIETAIAFTVETSTSSLAGTPASKATTSTRPSKSTKTTRATTKATKATKAVTPSKSATTLRDARTALPAPTPAETAISGERLGGMVQFVPTGRPDRYRVELTAVVADAAGEALSDLQLRVAVPSKGIPPIDVPLGPLQAGKATAADVVLPPFGTFQVFVGVTVGQFDAQSGTGTFRLA